MVNRGDVWWVALPSGRRPALVMTRASAIPVLGRLVVVPTTTAIRSIPTHLELDEEDGLPRRCALSFDNITTAPKDALESRITTLSPARMAQVCRAWRLVVDC